MYQFSVILHSNYMLQSSDSFILRVGYARLVWNRLVFQNGRGMSLYVLASTHLWRNLFKMVELYTNMWQHNDITSSEVLNWIYTGDHTYHWGYPIYWEPALTLVSLMLYNCKILCLALPCIYYQERRKLKSITHTAVARPGTNYSSI